MVTLFQHVDGNYSDLATATGGSVYRISENEIYTMKEIIRGH